MFMSCSGALIYNISIEKKDGFIMKALPVIIKDSPMLEKLSPNMSEKQKRQFVLERLNLHSIHRRRVNQKLRRMKGLQSESGLLQKTDERFES